MSESPPLGSAKIKTRRMIMGAILKSFSQLPYTKESIQRKFGNKLIDYLVAGKVKSVKDVDNLVKQTIPKEHHKHVLESSGYSVCKILLT
jgi:hypothetical protein